MGLRTDLALESLLAVNIQSSTPYPGITQEEFDKAQCHITRITVKDGAASDAIGKPIGEYVTIETTEGGLDAYPDYLEEQVNLIAEEINRLAPKNSREVLIIGLGNDDITPDALGPLVAKQIFATRHIPREMPGFEEFSHLKSVSALAPGVLGQTGIEVSEITKAVCDKTKPSLVIVVDALACSEISRLGNTIQISNTGISPGSGVKNSRKELSKNTLDANVIAIGVPTVVDMQTIADSIHQKETNNSEYKDIMVTPRSIDNIIDRSAKLISLAINKALQPSMSIEEISSLV